MVEKGIILFELIALLAKCERCRRPFFQYDRKCGRGKQSAGDKASHAVRLDGSPSGEISEAFERQRTSVGAVDGQPQVSPTQYNLQSHPNPDTNLTSKIEYLSNGSTSWI